MNSTCPLLPDTPDRRLLDSLVQAQHQLRSGDYAFFFTTGEGRYLPRPVMGAEIEEASGYVVDRHGHVFFFWLGWDAQRETPALTIWKAVQPEPAWIDDSEYRQARAAVGLA
jgi:hypothetical protein